MKKHLSTILLVLVFFVGLSVLLYPAASDYHNSKVQSKAIASYEQTVGSLTPKDYSAYFAAADDYNRRLREVDFPLMYPERAAGYLETLDISGTGIMGYITIPKIGVELPIYHTTDDAVLNVAAGHLEGTSLPVGGAGTHAVISAHRGLPSAKLFTELDKLTVGDVFTITILDRVLTYEVDQVLIVRPGEVDSIGFTDGEDYCTLLTCTPYGINTHRLLVRGARIETAAAKPQIYVPNDAYRVDPVVIAPLAAVPMLLVLLVILLVKYRKKK